jgi:hypothetical protein
MQNEEWYSAKELRHDYDALHEWEESIFLEGMAQDAPQATEISQ